jgi:tetratricopeptide (TPR) repeat protein
MFASPRGTTPEDVRGAGGIMLEASSHGISLLRTGRGTMSDARARGPAPSPGSSATAASISSSPADVGAVVWRLDERGMRFEMKQGAGRELRRLGWAFDAARCAKKAKNAQISGDRPAIHPNGPCVGLAMMRSCRTVTLLTALSILAFASGCSEKKDAAKAEPTAVAAAPAGETTVVDPDAKLPKNQKLALSKITGTTNADKSVTEAQKLLRQNMGKDDLWVMLGRAWVRKARESADPGFYLNADACAEVVLERSPDSRLATDLRGLVLLNGHKFDEARSLALQVTAKHPEDPMAWGTLSDAYLEMGRYDEATDAAQKMLDLKPNLPSYSRASYLQWLRGDVIGARETVRRALDSGRAGRTDPEPGAWVLVQAATLFWNEGDVDGADAGFDKALERVSDYAPANVGKGRVAMAKKDYKRAAELFERAWKVSPLVETAWLMGDAKEAAGDSKGAAEAYAAVQREGRRTDPRTLSLFLSTKMKNATDGEEALKLAREEYEVRKDIYTEDALAWALYRTGRIPEAKASIAKVRALGTPDARLIYHEGAIRLAAGETVKGKKLIADALKRNPAFDATAVTEAKALIDERTASR